MPTDAWPGAACISCQLGCYDRPPLPEEWACPDCQRVWKDGELIGIGERRFAQDAD